MTVIAQIKYSLEALSKAESKIAAVILDNPETIIGMTTGELARLANVSDPMISRFCRTIGCKSFPEFKLQLAQSLASKASFVSEAVSGGDSAEAYIEKRISANQSALEYIRSTIQPRVIEQTVQLLANANEILVFGMGGSSAVAHDAHHKLFRLGIPTSSYNDVLMQRMVAAAAKETTAIVIFSVTGRTTATIEAASIAKKSGAKLIGITQPKSPLAKLLDICIDSGNELEDTTMYIPMTTRIVSLTIIDILVTGVALSQGDEGDIQLKKIKQSLKDTKIDRD